jgi:hypothetical protein
VIEEINHDIFDPPQRTDLKDVIFRIEMESPVLCCLMECLGLGEFARKMNAIKMYGRVSRLTVNPEEFAQKLISTCNDAI